MAVPKLSIHEIDIFITQSHASDLLSASSRSHPVRPPCVHRLGNAWFQRHMLSNQKDYLDEAILHLTESVLIQRWSRPKPNSISVFFDLTVALYLRSTGSKHLEDAAYTLKYLRHIRDQLHQALGVPAPSSHNITCGCVGR